MTGLITRRNFILTGLVAAPTIVAINNIMKISPLEKVKYLDTSDIWYYVNDSYWMKKDAYDYLIGEKYTNFNVQLSVYDTLKKTFWTDLHKIKPGKVIRFEDIPLSKRKLTLNEQKLLYE